MNTKTRPTPSAAAGVAVASSIESAGTGEAMQALPSGAELQGDGTGEALPPISPAEPSRPAVTPHEWNDEFTGVGGSYVVIDGKRVPADQA